LSNECKYITEIQLSCTVLQAVNRNISERLNFNINKYCKSYYKIYLFQTESV